MNSGLPPARARIASASSSVLALLEPAHHELAPRLLIELAQLDRGHVRLRAHELGAMPWPPRGESEDRPRMPHLQPVLEQQDALLVVQVDVLDHDQHRPALRERGGQPPHELPQPIAPRERIEVGTGGSRHAERPRERLAESMRLADPVRLELGHDLRLLLAMVDAEEAREHVEEHAERHVAPRVGARGAKHPARRARQRRHEALDERTLADPRLAEHEDRSRLAGADRLRERVAQHLELELAAEQQRATARHHRLAPIRRERGPEHGAHLLEVAIDPRQRLAHGRRHRAAVAEPPRLVQLVDDVGRGHHRPLHVRACDAVQQLAHARAHLDLHVALGQTGHERRRLGDDDAHAQPRRALAHVLLQRERGPQRPIGVVGRRQQRAEREHDRIVVDREHLRVALERDVARERHERLRIDGRIAGHERPRIEGDVHEHHALMRARTRRVGRAARRIAALRGDDLLAARRRGHARVVAGHEVAERLVVDDRIGAVQERGEIGLQCPRALVALGQVAPQRPIDDRGQLLGHVGRHLAKRRNRLGAHALERGQPIFRAEQQLPGDELVHHDAERVHVAAPVDAAPLRLLGRHVRDLALDGLFGVSVVPAIVHVAQVLEATPSRARDPEVEDLHLTLVADHHVVRADVAVHDAERLPVVVGLAVRVGQRRRHLVREIGSDDGREAVALARDRVEQPHQIDALHELHREIERALHLSEIEHLHDVRVIERQRDLRLVDEHARELVVVDEVLADLLDHDPLGEPLGHARVGEVHLGHAALADHLREHVAAEHLGELRSHGQSASMTRLSNWVVASQPEKAKRSFPGPRNGC